MLKTFPIEFIRQIIEQKLAEEHIKDLMMYGGKEQIALCSFYEQLKSQDEVDRFVETFRDLTEQQNRMGLIGNGVILSPENPTITNLYSSLIIPMSFTCNMRCILANRDRMIWTINNLIEKLKGRKVDIAQLNCEDSEGKPYSQPFMVGTIGQNDGDPKLKNGDFLGEINSLTDVGGLIADIKSKGVKVNTNETYYLYTQLGRRLRVIKGEPVDSGHEVIDGIMENPWLIDGIYIYVSVQLDAIYDLDELSLGKGYVTLYGTDSTYQKQLNNGVIFNSTIVNDKQIIDIKYKLDDYASNLVEGFDGVFDFEDISMTTLTKVWSFYEDSFDCEIAYPPEHQSFDKYKVSLSFDSIRCDEPRNLNANEYCDLSFGGSATIVSHGVGFGNDLLKIGVKKIGIQAQSYISFSNPTKYWLEPLEMPSGNNANTQINQLISNNFISNSHTDSIAITLQYTFIYDNNVDLLKQLFKYGRYGTQGVTVEDISPNMDFSIDEIWCSWGDYENNNFKTKLVENVDIENTESDTLTLAITMQVQGDNN